MLFALDAAAPPPEKRTRSLFVTLFGVMDTARTSVPKTSVGIVSLRGIAYVGPVVKVTLGVYDANELSMTEPNVDDGAFAITNAVVAIWVVLVPSAAVGAVGVPVRAGEARGALRASEAAVALRAKAALTTPESVAVAASA